MNKIGLGIITCNREDFYKQCYDSVPVDVVDTLVTVNDGDKLKNTYEKSNIINHKTNKGVGISKNEAMQYLIDNNCDHIFLIEDDIIIKNKLVFEKYINAAKQTGLRHFMFGYHGPANKTPAGKNRPRVIVEYSTDCSIAFNQHCVGAFCYYHKSILDKVGLMDEQFKNAWEHVDHSLQIVKQGFIPAYWWWPDISNSCDYLDELACSEENSTIRWDDAEKKIPKKDWMTNIEQGAMHFVKKNNHMPGSYPDTSEQQIYKALKDIKLKYSHNEV